MKTSLSLERETWPIRGAFTISRGSKTAADVIVCRLQREEAVGWGECVPYPRYGESIESVIDQIEAMRALIEQGCTHDEIDAAMPAGAARNAIDCALWDLEAKHTGRHVHALVCSAPPRPIATAVTVSLADPEEMALATRALAGRPVIKVKLGGRGDADRMHAVRAAAPHARIILDANESWSEDDAHDLFLLAANLGIALIEQPFPAGEDDVLTRIPHPVPICADESVHTSADLDPLTGRYDCINIKLDKAGGLSEALRMRQRAHELGFSVMVGCMVGTSLSMAPAVLLAQEAEFVDLDGPLLLSRDRKHGLTYSSALVSPPSTAFWG